MSPNHQTDPIHHRVTDRASPCATCRCYARRRVHRCNWTRKRHTTAATTHTNRCRMCTFKRCGLSSSTDAKGFRCSLAGLPGRSEARCMSIVRYSARDSGIGYPSWWKRTRRLQLARTTCERCQRQVPDSH